MKVQQQNMQAVKDIESQREIDDAMRYRSFDIAYCRVEQKIFDCGFKELKLIRRINNVGSMVEGMPLTVCSDNDVMINRVDYPEVLWKFEPPLRSHVGGYVIAEENAEDLAYLLLKVNNNEPLHESLKCTINDNGYMKPDAFIAPVEGYVRKGPALQSFLHDVKAEYTNCLKCQSWPLVTNTFYTRERFTNWPSKKLLQKIYKLGCHVVGVGRHSSPLKEIEWRMSFSIAEKELCFELSEPYAKCMFALKALKKQHLDLKYKSDNHPTLFCSYFLKTACFWMCETIPHEDLNTLDLVKKTIDWLIDCYEHECLPHYFIPQQNLIGHLTTEQCIGTKKKLLVAKLFMGGDNLEHCRPVYEQLLPNTLLLRKAEMIKSKSTDNFNISHMLIDYERCGHSWQKLIPRLSKFTKALHRYIEKTVPASYKTFFIHHLYFSLGDACTSLLIYFKNQCLPENLAPNPLHYYTLGGPIGYPDEWHDDLCIGTHVHTIKYHYLMGNYEELKHEIPWFEPLIPELKRNVNIVNGLRKIYILVLLKFELNSWVIDDSILQRIKDMPTLIFNPIVFILYVMATLSLQEGDLDKASDILNDMKECLSIIYKLKVGEASQILIDIIDIEIIKVTRLLEMPEPGVGSNVLRKSVLYHPT